MIRLWHDIGKICCSLKGKYRIGQRNRIVSFHAVKIGAVENMLLPSILYS